ncbi:Methyltransferase domain-containing protein [Pedococcus dokdonensis]|uniref:Methyltransferase domain-containing protein n=1 Tax=Pedococcus dokdonensis TaxID=443156 RepID=A0A1H0QV88_9MICO|nr:class I SAM-dependent methyltransferase [Pedococcus dokdonensis]SDP21173.1 Methyltransferase domain-containing protein [Pedococcus dokdonensis]
MSTEGTTTTASTTEPAPQSTTESTAGSSTEQIRRYWDDFAAEYDSYPDHGLLDSDTRSAWKDLLRTWLPTTPSLVADLACGTGTMSVLMAELGHRVQGVDLSAEMVRLARAKSAPFGSAIAVEQGDAGEPPLEPGSFDVVFARHILWTLPEPTEALRRWAALLRPGGRLVLVEGRWGLEAAADKPALPWSAGVPSEELAGVVRELVGEPVVVQLDDAVFWGKEIEHERYLLRAVAR